jgi:hypothetical protein
MNKPHYCEENTKKKGVFTLKKENKETSSITRNFEPKDYNRNDEVSKGLATTHEQVSDYYMSGEVVPSEYESVLPRNAQKKSE